MATIVNADYISNLLYTPSNKLKSVKADPFLTALRASYGEDKVKLTVGWLTSPATKNSFSGMEDFQNRFITAISDNKRISVDDQKYIADIANRISIGILTYQG